MDLFFFFISVALYRVVIVLMVLIAILAVLLGIREGFIEQVIFFFLPLLILPPYFLDKLVSYFRAKREVQKYYSKRQYKRTLQSIQQKEQSERNHLSSSAAQENAQPLVSMAKQELANSRNFVTPAIFSRVENKLSELLKRGDVPTVNNVYEILINSNPESLNQKLTDFLTKLELRR